MKLYMLEKASKETVATGRVSCAKILAPITSCKWQ